MGMDDLLVKYLLKEADPDEVAQVQRWLSADEANQQDFDRLKNIWELSGYRAAISVPDSREALGRMRERLERARPGLLRWFGKWQAAAILIGLVFISAAMYIVLRRPGQIGPKMATVMLALPGTATLPDGSVVTLSPNAKIIYTKGATGNGRNVQMEGRASFSVVHDASHPFIVRANDISVRVLGTSFVIDSNPDSTQVFVETGSVEVRRNDERMILRAGERYTALRASLAKGLATVRLPVAHATAGATAQSRAGSIGQSPSRRSKDSLTVIDHRQVMRLIIEDLVKEKIIPHKDSLTWFGLDNTQFVVDGRTVPESLHAKFKSKYIRADGLGYYYGPDGQIKVHGTGYFYRKEDLL